SQPRWGDLPPAPPPPPARHRSLASYRLTLWRGLVELLLLRRAFHGRHRRQPAGRDLGDLVEVAHAHELLVTRRLVAVRLGRELAVLEVGVGRHPPFLLLPGQPAPAVV